MVIVADALFYKALDSIFGFVILVLMELILLIGLAGWLGVDYVTVLLHQLFQRLIQRKDIS